MKSRTAQLATTDLIISAIILLLFIALAIVAVNYNPNQSKIDYTYGSPIFTNIEGLGAKAFLSDYRIDAVKLAAFQAETYDNQRADIYKDTIFRTGSDDYCIFTNDALGATYLAGMVYDSVSGSMINCPVADPCADYDEVKIFAKPVLDSGKIKNLLVLICRP